MRSIVLAAVALGLAVPGVTQVPKVNNFHVYDGTVEHTSRGNLGDSEGEILMRVPDSHFGFLRTAVGMNFTIQDQDQSTPEVYHLIFRKSDGKGAPDITPAGVLYTEGPFQVFGSGSAVGVLSPSHTFKTPVTLPDGEFFYGVRLSQPGNGAGMWPTDGAGIHMSGMYPNQTAQGACGEHPRKGVQPDVAWQVLYQGGQPLLAAVPGGERAWLIQLHILGPALQAYAIDPIGGAPATPCASKVNFRDFGLAGLWPDLMDLEGYGYKARFGWRLREATFPGAPAVIFIASMRYPNNLFLPTAFGKWFLLPNDIYFQVIGGFPVTLGAMGEVQTAPFNLPDEARIALLGMYLYTQALVVDPATLNGYLSNWCGINF